jgi:hypothetical protein
MEYEMPDADYLPSGPQPATLDHARHSALFFHNWPMIRDNIRPFVVGLGDNRQGTLLGTGMLVTYRGSSFIFTAGHVVRDAYDLLGSGELALATLVAKGVIRLRAKTPAVARYEPNAARFEDAGIIRLDPDQLRPSAAGRLINSSH